VHASRPPAAPSPPPAAPRGRARVDSVIDRPERGDDAILVQMEIGRRPTTNRDSLAELRELVRSAGARIAGEVVGRRERPDPALYAGRGKVDEIAAAVAETGAGLVIFNHELTGAQERNLERALACRVVDRVTLILDIFAQRARSAEGKLQVELAQLQHMATRLVRGWTHLERQKGGIGLRGPGETQLETDRRLLGIRVKILKERLRQVGRQRETQRRSRTRGEVRSVALVGYTNAGKSTLFNRLTGARTYAADQLFATLDTTVRKLYLPGAAPLVVSDTVGFIRQLPHDLVAAFRATLQEAVDADLLLHVIDSSHPDRDGQIRSVDEVLAEIGAEHVPRWLVWNKGDLTGSDPGVERDDCGKIRAIRLSAASGDGCDELRAALAEHFPREAEGISPGQP
jgi:GTP-binding protein HflX